MSSVAVLFKKQPHKQFEASDTFAIPFAKVGVEMEVENYKLSDVKQKRLLPEWIRHEQEHSIRNDGMELVTNGGLVGAELEKQIRLFCKVAKENHFSEGYPRAGLHIHVDVTDMNGDSDKQLLRLVQAYMLFEHAFFGFAGDWRQYCGFCDAWLGSQHHFGDLASMLLNWNTFRPANLDRFSKYQALNFIPLKTFGTLEFRHMPMTFNDNRIIDWINICLCLKRFAMRDIDPLTLLLEHGVSSLIQEVFGEYAPILLGLIDEKKVWEAFPDVLGLEVFVTPFPLDPWEAYDSPLLTAKRLDKAPKSAPRAKPKRLGAQKILNPVNEQMVQQARQVVEDLEQMQGEF